MNILRKIRASIVNIICTFIPNKMTRHKVRAIMNSDISGYRRLIKRDLGMPIKKIKYITGFRGRNLILAVNDEYIYKFPLRHRNGDVAIREKRIVDALQPLSPIAIPDVDILEYKGKLVRKYKLIHGLQINQIPFETVNANKEKLARQIAKFMYEIGRANPSTIRDLKPNSAKKPGYMYGWNQGDIYDNFIVNIDTMKIIAFIDWEDSTFGDFSQFMQGARFENEQILVPLVRAEYDKLYKKSSK